MFYKSIGPLPGRAALTQRRVPRPIEKKKRNRHINVTSTLPNVPTCVIITRATRINIIPIELMYMNGRRPYLSDQNMGKILPKSFAAPTRTKPNERLDVDSIPASRKKLLQ